MAQGILVIAEQRRGVLSPVTQELIGAARAIKNDVGGAVSVAIIARDPASLAEGARLDGVDEVLLLPVTADEFQPDLHVAAAMQAVSERDPSLILAPHSVDGWGYAAALAVQADAGFATDVFAIQVDAGEVTAVRGAYGERAHALLEFPGRDRVLLALRPSAFPAAEGAADSTVTELSVPETAARSRHLEFIDPPSEGGVDIPGAEFILSIGRGVGEEDNVEEFAELAEQMQAVLGCSRPIADAGWLPKARQVGYSGKTASSCKLYLALGISGSVQHLAGMKHVENIIAVNSDANAGIFNVARYGVVGDMFEVSKELRQHFE
ncbi:electron transfer flavoprotein subunit alpha/FixB family protein [Methylonatrum kenyense]|uniref:electron transfer flavoprotein subunit alpha/FixB family protein n=1 Tax=Methylonatrum kenyense TaxID=455253 RepID=UPI0020C0A54A|nr:electron transfer flavoprotein subunit alpha/FixB family protein [Methylonatrum kenyense]MCK8515145.1 electron transfer flavoprotein subunit alpha/FixB family protein [Methylonatrum kenyense]